MVYNNSLVFLYLSKLLFSVRFPQFKCNFVRGHNIIVTELDPKF